MPVNLDRPGDMPGVLEQHIFVGLAEGQVRAANSTGARLLGQPVGADHTLGLGAVLALLPSSRATVKPHLRWAIGGLRRCLSVVGGGFPSIITADRGIANA